MQLGSIGTKKNKNWNKIESGVRLKIHDKNNHTADISVYVAITEKPLA